MKKYSFILLIPTLLMFSHCENTIEENHCEFLTIVGEPDIEGKWQVYEKGSSPGSGYVIEKVPNKPAQIVEFRSDNILVTNVLGDYSYYYLITDLTTGEDIVALYKTEQNAEEITMADLGVSYALKQCENGKISLSFRYCREGCHLGLKRI